MPCNLILVATANRSAITLGDEDDLRSDIAILVDVDNIRVTVMVILGLIIKAAQAIKITVTFHMESTC